MGTITIHFEGICTQVKLGTPIDDALHRVVLVHAENGDNIHGCTIPPHYAFLEIDSLSIQDMSGIDSLPCMIRQLDGNWHLNAARIRVAGAVPGGPTYQPSSYSIPSLTTLTADFGALSPDVVFGNNAACHFDISSGTFSGAQTEGGSWYTDVEVTTTDPASVLLSVTDMRHPGLAGTITLKSGTTIVVTNTGAAAKGDSQYDFFLHYLTAKNLPDDAKIPSSGTPARYEGLGPSCSNSIYP